MSKALARRLERFWRSHSASQVRMAGRCPAGTAVWDTRRPQGHLSVTFCSGGGCGLQDNHMISFFIRQGKCISRLISFSVIHQCLLQPGCHRGQSNALDTSKKATRCRCSHRHDSPSHGRRPGILHGAAAICGTHLCPELGECIALLLCPCLPAPCFACLRICRGRVSS
jgi:hypothetical protein